MTGRVRSNTVLSNTCLNLFDTYVRVEGWKSPLWSLNSTPCYNWQPYHTITLALTFPHENFLSSPSLTSVKSSVNLTKHQPALCTHWLFTHYQRLGLLLGKLFGVSTFFRCLDHKSRGKSLLGWEDWELQGVHSCELHHTCEMSFASGHGLHRDHLTVLPGGKHNVCASDFGGQQEEYLCVD